jgi:hypothetical protein
VLLGHCGQACETKVGKHHIIWYKLS